MYHNNHKITIHVVLRLQFPILVNFEGRKPEDRLFSHKSTKKLIHVHVHYMYVHAYCMHMILKSSVALTIV
jgi:hypothetical protein